MEVWAVYFLENRVKWDSESLKLHTKLSWLAAYFYILAVYLKFDENPDGVQDLRITFSLSEYKFLILLKSGGTPLWIAGLM